MQYTLSQLLGIVKQSVDELMGEFQFWCVADVMSVQTKGKFTYIELAEVDIDGNILAKIRANIRDSTIITAFIKATGISTSSLKNQRILFSARVSFHVLYGFSFTIDTISSEYTLGNIATAQQKIIDTLTSKGIINNNTLLTLGLPPFSLAIISGETSAGMEDFFAILNDSGIKYTFHQYLCAIQGNNAKYEVATQLQNISKDIDSGNTYTIVCIVRGGGGASDMTWQNDIDIATAICEMKIPVLVAIGHTQDSSVLEHVAWGHAKTPSDAAYVLVQEYTKYSTHIDVLYTQISTAISDRLQAYKNDIPYVLHAIIGYVQQRASYIYNDIAHIYETICLYHPHHILSQGYALIRKKGDIVNKNIGEVLGMGDTIEIELQEHTISARIESIEKKS